MADLLCDVGFDVGPDRSLDRAYALAARATSLVWLSDDFGDRIEVIDVFPARRLRTGLRTGDLASLVLVCPGVPRASRRFPSFIAPVYPGSSGPEVGEAGPDVSSYTAGALARTARRLRCRLVEPRSNAVRIFRGMP